ncbi:MAG: exosortase B [Sulfuritalea sp.]|nr:exosortase B [Sulfuritalea sp.]
MNTQTLSTLLQSVCHPKALPWLIVLIGWLAMYLPVYWWALNGIWQEDDHAHGLIVFLVVAGLIAFRGRALPETGQAPSPWLGWMSFIIGLVFYFAGRALDISILFIGSQIPVLLGVLLLLGGWQAVRVLWFPLVFIVFMIPLPGTLVDALTGPLKHWVSHIADALLHVMGYPTALDGVMLTVGQYQLLVADACSGLNSMFSLSALGTLYMYLLARKSPLHNAIMLASILPIAFSANIVRVMALVLITFHLGDEAGQGFMHGAAGIVLIMAALSALFLLDSVLARLIRPRTAGKPAKG